ncbi:30S ribosomal protein S7 [Candidatus Campbellbacteria bacterium]|nr:30S ribosomal protein S7 [Candidatus Campbellbacteria bacterium]|tara:strand:- start:20049 stop:20519 length:471 start_codon:yes stop_codon:yes gene_type:complete
MRRPVKNRKQPQPDSVYNSVALAKFINYIMLDGKKETARKIVYGALDIIKEKESDKEPLEVFEAALKNAGPSTEVRSRRVGGANYQVPVPVRPERQLSLAMRWIINGARSKKGNDMKVFLADELLQAAAGEGEAVKKKETVLKMAEANKAFAHFAW